MPYLRYDAALEEIGDDETEIFQKIADTFAAMGEKVRAQEGQALRVSHAKATALLTGELTVDGDLPAELAQGLAARPGRYPAIVRFAQGPGEVLGDEISTHRGMAVKILGADGRRIPESDEPASQDFVLEGSGKAFINADASRFLANLRGGVSNAPSLPEGVKSAVSKVARATEAGLEAVGLQSKTLSFFGHPPLHPLAEAYFSQVPMRWGDHVAKVGFYPSEATRRSIADVELESPRTHDAFRAAMLDHFASHGAEFELRVQLATDLETTPIEDATREWPEEGNPYRRVARLVIAPQTAWSAARDAYANRLSFRPAHSLEAHRPLGQVMRARLFVYGKLAASRQRDNGGAVAPPRVEDVPA